MRFLFVSGNSPHRSSRTEWRGRALAGSIQRMSCHTTQVIDEYEFAANSPSVQKVCAAADVIVIQMLPGHPLAPAIQRWKARDKVLIADIDPLAIAFAELAGEGPGLAGETAGQLLEGTAFESQGLSPFEDLARQARLVDALTLPTARFLNDWKLINDAYLLPDFIDLDRYANITRAVHDGIVVGWSSEPRQRSKHPSREVLAALERVCQKRSQVRVAVWGEDSALLDQLSIQLAQKFRPTGFDQWGWPRQLAYIDIGLAPVFNLAEERLRRQDVLEYMSMKIPWLASEFPDDRELRPYGWLVQNSASAWERVLLDMVDHLEAYMDEAAGEPYLFGISQALDENLNKVLSIYTSIWKKSRQ